MLFETLQLTPVQLVLSVFIIFIAYTVKGLSGFGSGLIAILLSYGGTVVQSLQLRKHSTIAAIFIFWHSYCFMDFSEC